MVSCPLEPDGPVSTKLPHVENVHRILAREARKQELGIPFLGDTACENITLVLGIRGLQNLREATENARGTIRPVEIFALCPATDLRNNNPEIDSLKPKDSLFG
jgi:hypothetical protein